ncbi:MAG: tetratricopeptide repeat protein [Pseudomonadota bacterium]
MVNDQWGLPVSTTSPEAARHLDAAVTDYLGFGRDTGPRLKRALALDPDMAMALCVRGYFFKLFADAGLEPKAARALAAAERAAAGGAQPRERRHIAALGAWCAGNLRRAAELWDDILIDDPRDVMAIRLAHFAHFYLGHAARMRDSIARVLPAWDEGVPGYGFILGAYAFGLEESGDWGAAEAFGRRAVAINPADIWAVHAVAHVMEMQGRHREGIEWLAALEPHWSACNNFAYHVWWHRALFHLELGQYDDVLSLYDRRIRADQSNEYLDISNGVSLLWRLEDDGVDVGERWRELADKSETRATEHLLAFADAHFVMALAADHRIEAARSALESIEALPKDPDNTETAVLAEVGLPLLAAILAFRSGDFSRTVDLLLPIRYEIYRIGGSHAQRDVCQRMLLLATVRSGRLALARALLAERTRLKPNSPWTWTLYGDVLARLGEAAGAAAARRRAAARLAS